jgi:hypothetical protein
MVKRLRARRDVESESEMFDYTKSRELSETDLKTPGKTPLETKRASKKEETPVIHSVLYVSAANEWQKFGSI